MNGNNANGNGSEELAAVEKIVEKKSKSKKPLVAVLAAAILAIGAFGANEYFNKDTTAQTQDREKVTIKVVAKNVLVNDQEQKLGEGQTWKEWLQEYFAKKDMKNTDVVVDYTASDLDAKNLVETALKELQISVSEEIKAGK